MSLFAIRTTKKGELLLWPERPKVIREHVKNICSHKERPIGINDAVGSRGHRKCAFVCVCECKFEVCLVWVSQTHLFPTRMDLTKATGQGAHRFIRLVISGVSDIPGCSCQASSGNFDALQVGKQSASDSTS